VRLDLRDPKSRGKHSAAILGHDHETRGNGHDTAQSRLALPPANRVELRKFPPSL